MEHATDHFEVLPSAARTVTPTTTDIVNGTCRGVQVILDLTAFTTAASLTVIIEGKDPTSGKYYTLLQSAAITSVSTTVLRVYPGLTAAANQVASDSIPRTFRVRVTHGNGNSHTYSCAASTLF